MNGIVQKSGKNRRASGHGPGFGLRLILLLALLVLAVPAARAQAPANDLFTNATTIVGTDGFLQGSNVGATRETNEPIHYVGSPFSSNSVWFKWTAPADGVVTFDTIGTYFGIFTNGSFSFLDTVLAAYTLNGTNGVGSLRKITSDDDSGGVYPSTDSLMRFAVRTGTNYYIALDGYRYGRFGSSFGSTGPFQLHWTMGGTPPIFIPPDVVQFSSTSYSVIENQLFADITLWYGGDSSGGALGDVSVDLFTADGTAINGTNYVGTNVTVVFLPGETIKTVSIPIIDDFTANLDRTLFLGLANATNVSLTNGLSYPTNAVLTILDDDRQFNSIGGEFNFSSSSYYGTENETDAALFGGFAPAVDQFASGILRDVNLPAVTDRSPYGVVIMVTRSLPAVGRVMVDYHTEVTGNTNVIIGPIFGNGGTFAAKQGVDFSPVSGTLVFDDYQMSASFIVPVFSNTVSNNADAVFDVVLSNPRPAPEEEAGAVVPVLPFLGSQSRATVEVLEVNEGFKTFNFERSLYRYDEYEPLQNSIPSTNGWKTNFVDVLLPGGGGGSVDVRMWQKTPSRYLHPLQAGSDYATLDRATFFNTPNTEGRPPIVNEPDFADFQQVTINFPSQGLFRFRQRAFFAITNDNTVEFNEDVRIEFVNIPQGYSAGPDTTVTIPFDDQPAGAADREWNPEGVYYTQPPFNSTPGANNSVSALVVQDDNRTVIVGDFTAVNTVSRNRVARLNPDGSLDTTFNPGTGADNFIETIALYPASLINPAQAGKMVVGGGFTSINNISRRGIARLNPNGSLDTTFNPGNGADGTVHSVALQSDGKILVAGDFTHFNDLPVSGLMRLNEDGTLDSTFNPGTGANGTVWRVVVRDAAVPFTVSRGSAGSGDRNVIDTGSTQGTININYDFGAGADNIRVYYEGVRILDVTANTNGQVAVPYGPGTATSVEIVMNEAATGGNWSYQATITPGVAGRSIYLAGEFTSFNGLPLRRVARLFENGSVDSSFNPGVSVNGPVYAMAVQPNNRVLLGGNFSKFQNASRNSLVRLLGNGALDVDFHVGTGASDSIYAITLQPDSKIYIGGVFQSYNGTRRMGIARLFGNGALDTSFMDTAYNQFAGLIKTFSFDPPRYVNAIGLQLDGNVMIGGSFTKLGGNFSYNHPGYAAERLHAPFTRADKVTRFNIARLVGGYTDGPGNIEFDPAATTFSVDENSGTFSAPLRRVDGRLGEAFASSAITYNTATPDDVSGSFFSPTWEQRAFVAPVSVGFTGFRYFQIPIFDDNLREGDETFDLSTANVGGSLNLGDDYYFIGGGTFFGLGGEYIPVGAARGYFDTVKVTIADNEFDRGEFNFAQPEFVVNENSAQATITVIRTNGSSGPVDVRVLVLNGTAQAGQDYVAPAALQTLSFASGQTTNTFTVSLLDDALVEPDETITLVLTNATGGATLPGGLPYSTATAVLTIIDNDFLAGHLNFSATNYDVSETKTQAVVTVTRTGGSQNLLSVQYSTFDDTATAPADYGARSGTLTWNSGDSSSRTIVIPLVADGLVEGPETVQLRLFNASIPGALGDRTNATLTILDGDAYGSLSFSQPYYVVGENDASPIITVTRSGGIGGTVSVNYLTYAITATNGFDYNDTSGTLTFLPGELSKTFQVPVLDDTEIDGDKTFGIGLASPVNATLGAISDVVVTLVDNESVNAPAGSLDTTFSTSSAANGAVYALALQNNGAIVMAGDFTEVGSVPRSHLARLDASGVLDEAFDIGPGANDSIRALALQSDGRLFVGGLFTTINGTNRSRLARLSIDGKVDTSFDPGAGADNPVLALAVQADDKVIAGGSFSSFRGLPSPGLIRLNTNGTVDASFNVGAGINGTVYALGLQSDGKLLVGGNFISYNGLPRTNLVRLNIDGSIDAGFNPTLSFNAPVLALLSEADGKIVVGGSFTGVSGAARRFLVRLDQTGVVDPGFLGGAGEGADNVVYAIKQQVDGKLIVSGDFRRFNDVTRNGITRLNDVDGSTDPTINFGEGANAFVAALIVQPDRKIILGGGFSEYDAQPRQFLARIYGGSISGPGTLEFGRPEFQASEAGTNAVITVRRRGGTTGAVSAHYATSDGTAVAGQDYLAAAGDLSFAQGETFQSFFVQILPNDIADGDRIVQMDLSNFVGATPGPQPSATLMILDDENTVRFTSAEYSIGENPVSGNATIGVFRSGSTNTTVTVDFVTGSGTAAAGLDYVATNGTLVFLPGEVFKNFNVRILDDALTEGNETVPLSLINPSAGTSLTLASAALVIVDNDFAPGQFLFATNNFVVNEGAGNAVVTVLRTNGSSGPVSVRLRTSNGTAFSGLDYTETDRIVTFGDGESAKLVAVPLIDDSIIEGNETLNLALSEPSPGTSILLGNAIVTILDNDAGIIVGAGSALVSESLVPANSLIDPGETVTVLYALRNAGIVDASGVTATLVYTNGITHTVPQTQSYGTLIAGGNSVSRPFTFTAQGTNGAFMTVSLIITNNGTYLTTISYNFVLGRPAVPFLNSSLITINDNAPASPYPSTLTVSNVSGLVNHLTVTLYGVTHRYPDDLDIVLVSPNGTKVMLMSDAGGGNPNELNNVTITFDDSAVRVIPDSTVITNGSYRPANYLAQNDPFPLPGPVPPYGANLSAFDGSDPNGVWSLYVVDDSATDSGSIASGWSLNIANTNVVFPDADLSVSAVASPDPASAGGTITYTIGVTNHGPGSAASVNLTSVLPAGVSLINVSGPGSYTLVGNVLTHSLGGLSMGAGVVVNVTVTVPAIGSLLTFDATVSAGQPDLNPANSHVSIQTTVTGGTPVVPMLFGARSNGQIVLSWSGTSTNLVLQGATLLNAGAWGPVGIAPVTNNGISTVTVPIDAAAKYFRLKYVP